MISSDEIDEIDETLFFPETRIKRRFVYNEVEKYLTYLGYEIKVNEEEYYQLENIHKIPAICSLKHGLRYIDLNRLKKGYPCCKECGQEKRKQTCLEKYGVEHPMKIKEIREKHKQTCMEKYGTENPSQNEKIKEKKKQTSLKNFGVEYGFQSEEIKEKIKQSCLEKYG